MTGGGTKIFARRLHASDQSQTPSIPGVDPRSDGFQGGGRESKFFAVEGEAGCLVMFDHARAIEILKMLLPGFLNAEAQGDFAVELRQMSGIDLPVQCAIFL